MRAPEDSVHHPAGHWIWCLAIALVAQLLAWRFSSPSLAGDELRYLEQANNYLAGAGMFTGHGLSNPPLLPWIAAMGLKVGMTPEQLFMPGMALILVGVLLLRAALRRFVSAVWANVLALLIALHPVMLTLGPSLLSEPYAIFAAALFAFAALRLLGSDRWQTGAVGIMLAGLAVAMLAQLKPLFGYATLAGLFIYLIIAGLSWRKNSSVRLLQWKRHSLRMALVMVLGLLINLPFLSYTHEYTGKRFAWGTESGDHWYWMSIGGEDVWGSWFPDNEATVQPWLIDNGYAAEIEHASTLDPIERERYLNSLAFERLRESPQTYVRNVVANIGRVLFNYPYTFRFQSLGTYGHIAPNGALTVLFVVFLVLAWRNRHLQDALPNLLLLYFLIYLGGNFLVGSTGRQSLPAWPAVLCWISYQVFVLIRQGAFVPAALGKRSPL